MIRKNNNRNMKHRGGSGGGQRRYQNNGGGGNRGNDSGNIQRQKHHATQQLGKYNDLARNAQINGDRVDVEYYLQHVDHYTRVLTDIAAIEAERYSHQRESQIVPGGPNDPNAAEYNAAQAAADQTEGGGETSGSSESSGDQSGGGVDTSQQHQPRMTRQHQPRRQHYSAPAGDNGAAEANSNDADIPLPGGILPPI